jgi:cytochrome c553
MRRTTTAVLTAAVLALAGCSSSSDNSTKPTATPSATASPSASTPSVDQLAACTDAIVAGNGQDGPECEGLSPDDLFKAVQAANKRGRDALQSAIASASAAG